MLNIQSALCKWRVGPLSVMVGFEQMMAEVLIAVDCVKLQ
jgi:hypothetical protein